MTAVAQSNLALRFLLELCALAALGYCGYEAGGWPLAVLFPLVAAVIWGLFVSPRRRYDAFPLRIAAEALVLGGAAAALVATGQAWLGIALAVAAVVNRALMAIWQQ